jgi:lysosomal acid phosphatase
MFNASILLVLYSISSLIAITHGEDELVLVQAVWRHGDRAPTGTFASDKYSNESLWPIGWPGWGQLTPIGMTQHFKLGLQLANEYSVKKKLFSPLRYKSDEIYVRSTDVNRTLISAMSNFIGFYNNTGVAGRDFPDIANWPTRYVPVPIHTVDDDTDYLGNPDRECKRMDALYKLVAETPEYKNFSAANKDFLANVSKLAGQEINIMNSWIVYDSLYIEKLYNLPQPEWDPYYKRIQTINDISDNWIDGIGLSPVNGVDFSVEAAKIRGGPLLWAIIEQMQGKVNCLKGSGDSHYCRWMNPLKYYVYSAHDTTVAALFSTFGFKKSNFNETGLPHYSSCVTLELWKKSDNSFYVKVFYFPLDKDARDHDYEEVTHGITGCENVKECTLDQFVKRSAPYKMDSDPKTYCANTDLGVSRSSTTSLSFFGAVIALSLAMIGRTL